ncbi:MAG TPA: hypothetical protein VLZ74_02750 [Methylocella sp.]|nr:hypothetical protein [Methylocella sp.]
MASCGQQALVVSKVRAMQKTPPRYTLFYGDNLAILRDHIADESVDLFYFDPPFNFNASYNVLFNAPDGQQAIFDGQKSARPHP